jgi:isoquinoline 1-oxidoreductase
MKAFDQPIPSNVTVTPVKEWKVLGTPTPRPNGHDIVTGAHKYPSDISRPGMLYGKILRAPSYGARLTSIDLAPAKEMKDVVAVHEEQFVGVAAPTSFQAEQALAAISKTANGILRRIPRAKSFTITSRNTRRFPRTRTLKNSPPPNNRFVKLTTSRTCSIPRSNRAPRSLNGPMANSPSGLAPRIRLAIDASSPVLFISEKTRFA